MGFQTGENVKWGLDNKGIFMENESGDIVDILVGDNIVPVRRELLKLDI